MSYAYRVDPLAHARMHERSHELSRPRMSHLPQAFTARKGGRSAHFSRTPCLRHFDVGHNEPQSSEGHVSVERVCRSQCLPRQQS